MCDTTAGTFGVCGLLFCFYKEVRVRQLVDAASECSESLGLQQTEAVGGANKQSGRQSHHTQVSTDVDMDVYTFAALTEEPDLSP